MSRADAQPTPRKNGAASTPDGRFGEVGSNNPQVRFHDTEHAGWVRIEIDRTSVRTDMRMIADRTIANPIIHSGATFAMPRGARRLRRS